MCRLRNLFTVSLLFGVCSVFAVGGLDSRLAAQEAAADGEVHAADAAGHDDSAAHDSEGDHDDGEHGIAEHGDTHGAFHDPTDLSHQNASSELDSPAQFKSDLAIWTFVVFLLLLLILAKFAWGPIIAGLEKREQGIAAKIEEAQRSADQAAKQLQQYEAKLAAAAEEAREIVAEARRDAESAHERIVAEANQAADRERQRAIEDITTAKNVAVQEITDRSVELAVVMAGKLMRREVNADDRAQLIRDSLDQIPSKN